MFRKSDRSFDSPRTKFCRMRDFTCIVFLQARLQIFSKSDIKTAAAGFALQDVNIKELHFSGLPSRSSERLMCSPFSMARLRFASARQSSLSAVLRAKTGGAEGIRTPDLLIANQPLYQLSYDPSHFHRCRNKDYYAGLCPDDKFFCRPIKMSAGRAITHDLHRQNPPTPAF